ncbi:MAG: ABC transporter transmembrane domain-containing protein, partial [Pseudomonadota bacterium]
MESSLIAFGWRHSRLNQLVLLALTVATFPLIYASLEIPKIIINDAINGGPGIRDVFGLQFGQIPYLFALAGVFLGLVVVINGLKWLINVGIGMVAERLLRRLRYGLFEALLRLPPRRLRELRPRESVQTIMGEVDNLGGFLGEIFVTPLFQGGQLLVFLAFIFVQDPLLGFAAIALYPVQAFVVPLLQRRIIALNRARSQTSRALADRLGEGLGAIDEMRLNATAPWHLAQVAGLLHRITMLRREIYQRKFTIKWINNFLTQLTPFFLFAIGGYLVIKGELDFGSLVAVLAAYKDLAPPWKALLGYYQRWIDFSTRFRNIVESTTGGELLPPEAVTAPAPGPAAAPLEGALTAERLRLDTGGDRITLDRLRVEPGTTLAVTGGPPGAAEALLRVLAGVDRPDGGRVALGGQDLAAAPMAALAEAVAYVGPRPLRIGATLRDSALYALKRRLPVDDPADAEAAARRAEARRTGNTPADPAGDWTDYDRAGLADAAALETRLLAIAEDLGLADTLYAAALGGRIARTRVERWAPALTALRAEVAARRERFVDLIEPWREDRLNANASLVANLLYAMPAEGEVGDTRLAAAMLAEGPVLEILTRTGGLAVLEGVGWAI